MGLRASQSTEQLLLYSCLVCMAAAAAMDHGRRHLWRRPVAAAAGVVAPAPAVSPVQAACTAAASHFWAVLYEFTAGLHPVPADWTTIPPDGAFVRCLNGGLVVARAPV